MKQLSNHVAVDPSHVTAVEWSDFYRATRVLVSGQWVSVDRPVGEVLEALGVGV